MFSLQQLVEEHLRGNDLSRSLRQKGVKQGRKLVVADAVRQFIMQEGAVSNVDIHVTLTMLPRDLREALTFWPDSRWNVADYALHTRNPSLIEGRVKVIPFTEAARRFCRYDLSHVIVGSNLNSISLSSDPSLPYHISSQGVFIYHKNLDQVESYLAERVDGPVLTGKYTLRLAELASSLPVPVT